MEQSFNVRPRWKSKIIGAYALTFVAVTILIDCIPVGLTASSSTIASSFLSFLKGLFLPPGWGLVSPAGLAKFEVDAITSALLAFLACSPIAAYAMVRLVSPPNLGRRTLAALVIGAAAVSCAGAVWGLAADRYYFIASIPPYFGLMPVVSGYDFYIVLLRGILGWALAFISPINLVFFIQLRRDHGLRWHL